MKVGFEYEGHCIAENVLQDDRRNFIYNNVTTVSDGIKNPFNLPEDILFTRDPGKYGFNEDDFRDGYSCLAELRLMPVESTVNIEQFVKRFYTLKDFLFDKNAVAWKEHLVSDKEHQESVWNLNKEIVLQRRNTVESLKRFTGEHIHYDFKTVLTLDSAHEVTDWIKDHDCRYRGGGLHINISPVEPKDVAKVVKAFHEALFPLNSGFRFQSKYRKELIFRYRDYNGTPGFEYMTLGFPLSDMSVAGVTDMFTKIFEAINEIPKQLNYETKQRTLPRNY